MSAKCSAALTPIFISLKNCSGEGLLHLLDSFNIYVSTGSACDSINDQLSHVIRAIGVSENYAYGTLRISLGKENTIEEIRVVASKISDLYKKVNNNL